MTQDEFEAPRRVLAGGWPGDFSDGDAAAYFFLLEDFPAVDVLAALKALVGRSRFRPSASDIVAVLSPERAGQPTFGEMFELLFGTRGALTARGVEGTRARLADMHPLVAGFAERSGIQRLKELPVHDPDDGHWRKQELEQAWTEHVQACELRGTAALAARSGSDALTRLDPLAALGLGGPPELGA
jgi:uncharacterized protein with von Willebrand factor type A (vWA) domain